jgi:hypothetical protein
VSRWHVDDQTVQLAVGYLFKLLGNDVVVTARNEPKPFLFFW